MLCWLVGCWLWRAIYDRTSTYFVIMMIIQLMKELREDLLHDDDGDDIMMKCTTYIVHMFGTKLMREQLREGNNLCLSSSATPHS